MLLGTERYISVNIIIIIIIYTYPMFTVCPPHCPSCLYDAGNNWFDCTTACANTNNATVLDIATVQDSVPYDVGAAGEGVVANIGVGQDYCRRKSYYP